MTDKKTLIVPVLLITLGVGWLLTTLGVVPEINWVWTLGVALVGVLTIAIEGFDKVTAVVGPFFYPRQLPVDPPADRPAQHRLGSPGPGNRRGSLAANRAVAGHTRSEVAH